jgi:hypothetical protein
MLLVVAGADKYALCDRRIGRAKFIIDAQRAWAD